MSKKIWCFFGVHEYKIINNGPYEKTWDGYVTASGDYYILQCNCCGDVKRRILCK